MADLPVTADDTARSIARAAELAGSDAPFVERYLRDVDVTTVAGRSPQDLLTMATTHRELARQRRAGEPVVQLREDTLFAVTEDRPFLVDSVLGRLGQEGITTFLLVHPVFVVERDGEGHLAEVLDLDPRRELPPGTVRESWIRVELSRPTDPEGTVQGIREVLLAVTRTVEDWEPMREAMLALADRLADGDGVCDPEDQAAGAEFLRWLVEDNFTFIGSRDHVVEDSEGGGTTVSAIRGSGLGVLRDDDAAEAITPLGSGESAQHRECVTIGKSSEVLPVHRVGHPDLIAVRVRDGERVIETRFAGLFSSTAYTGSVLTIPLICDKVAEVLERGGWAKESHSGAFVMRLLEGLPRDELFQAPVDHLFDMVHRVQQMSNQVRTVSFLRVDSGGQFVTAMVYLPRDRYTTAVRSRVEDVLRDGTGADEVSYSVHVSEEPMARIYCVLRSTSGIRLPEGEARVDLEAKLADATRSWDERLLDAAQTVFGSDRARELLAPWVDAFPLDYTEDFAPHQAVADLRNVLTLGEDTPVGCALYDPGRGHGSPDPHVRRFKIFSIEELTLDELMPMFADLGVQVVEEEPYTLTRRDGRTAEVYDFAMRMEDASLWESHSHEDLRELVESTVLAVRAGATESDGFNALVIRAGLTWREVALLRAIARYIRQIGGTWDQSSIEAALVGNHEIARDVVALFRARFDPELFDGVAGSDRDEAQEEVRRRIRTALEDVASLEHDRIVRAFVDVVGAMLRTNYYAVDDAGEPLPRMSFKIVPGEVPDMPLPHPAFEIWVHSPQLEGVHLRFGAVARGGLRWSDRRDDFRTEVLGLVKAQMVKNAVIVPTGSKGGFFAKNLPDPAVDRDAWQQAGRAAYTQFISGMLDVTDNRVGEDVVPPSGVVRHDGDDSYLVVAADKGTASFSDLANSISREYGFWLDDAFASGGSVGYDHKGMGITARGAWESVKRHFRELDLDTQTEDFTVVGIGDMSGDVFGNGMLCSEHIRLVAAFNHLHVFIDPNPDAATSYAERRRLFELPRSSWGDYDESLISEGGGVWSRSAKSVPVSEQAAHALGLSGPTSMTPNELIHQVLQAPVDLLWNGGIGTYIKAGTETDTEVGDRANDAIRVDGSMIGARVVGEGGNLGATQRGRIEAAEKGVQINTDAVDNSAGVDTSDHEVNIKILLGGAVRDGRLDEPGRVELLASMTHEVAAQVLRDNYKQNVLLGNARAQDGDMLAVHERLMESLEERGELDRELEFLPSTSEVHRRMEQGRGLSSPELAVLMAYSKLVLKDDLVESDLPDDPATARQLSGYFPTPLRERFADQLETHPLRREIVTTAVANDIVNRGGITFVHRAGEETSATPAQVARAFLVCREVFGLDDFVGQVEALDNVVPTAIQTRLYLNFRRLMDRSVRWFLSARPGRVHVLEEIERFAAVSSLTPKVPDMLRGSQAERFRSSAEEFVQQGVPAELARHAGVLLDQFSLLDIVDIAHDTGMPAESVAETYFTLSETFGIDELLILVTRLPREEQWDALARGALRDDLYATLQTLTRSVLAREGEHPQAQLEEWSREHDESLERVRSQLSGIRQLARPGIAALSVALRTLRSVTR
ncbi:NAD-glutamate dehydrogenase [Janibacter corallicola]|uniref:NAD-glutamate dehydrogenase n=1 Tax=Janibacter corallicola TaxID=415212 RepID=UPI00082EAC68|nr:NAD-glutamate dehydrogenase [Janibacter corallicola]